MFVVNSAMPKVKAASKCNRILKDPNITNECSKTLHGASKTTGNKIISSRARKIIHSIVKKSNR